MSVIDWDQQPYSVRVDTTRLSPATALPNEFSPHWVESIFSSAVPDNWKLSREVEVARKEVSVIRRPDGDQMDAELLDRDPSGGIGVNKDLLKIDTVANAPRYLANDAALEVIIDINCAQGICELLVEHGEGGLSELNHTVILDTSDGRVWRAAIAKLARSISTD